METALVLLCIPLQGCFVQPVDQLQGLDQAVTCGHVEVGRQPPELEIQIDRMVLRCFTVATTRAVFAARKLAPLPPFVVHEGDQAG